MFCPTKHHIGPRRVFNARLHQDLRALEQERIQLRFHAVQPVEALMHSPLRKGRVRLRKLGRKKRRGRRARPKT